jgi:hypothetical protein
MSETKTASQRLAEITAQKEALAKGRHALRLHLNAVGAGTKKRMRGKSKYGGALLAAGY